jgi:polar amino acid transport system substrate-binding protein
MPVSFSLAANSLQVAASWGKPPYIMPSTHSGFEIELITDVFKDLNHDVNFVYMSYDRTVEMSKRKQVDVILPLNEGSGVQTQYLSEVYVSYQNVALSLKGKNLSIKKLKDLSQFSIVGFQSAAAVLGTDFSAAVENSPLYIEMADQSRQLELLFSGAVDVIIMDVNILVI